MKVYAVIGALVLLLLGIWRGALFCYEAGAADTANKMNAKITAISNDHKKQMDELREASRARIDEVEARAHATRQADNQRIADLLKANKLAKDYWQTPVPDDVADYVFGPVKLH